jgi:hypothetical protein
MAKDARRTWHFIRIESRESALLTGSMAGIDQWSGMLFDVAGAYALGPLSALPVVRSVKAADLSALQTKVELSGRMAARAWMEQMTEEFRHALERIDWSTRFAQQPKQTSF